MKQLLCAMLFTALALGCKARTESDNKSLGELTGQSSDADREPCAGPYDTKFEDYMNWKIKESSNNVVESIEIEDQYKDAVKKALSAIPTELKDFFFSNGGRLIYMKDKAAIVEKCGAMDASPYIGCSQIREDEAYTSPYVYINISDKLTYAKEGDTPEQSIRRQIEQGTLVAFGLGLHKLNSLWDNQIMPRVSIAPNGGDAPFFEDSTTLTWFFLIDLYRTKYKMEREPNGDSSSLDFAEVNNLLDDHKYILNTDPNVLKIVDGKFVDENYQQRWAKLRYQLRQDVVDNPTHSPARGAELRELVFAHAFDGYYCSTTGSESSREVMKSTFKNAFVQMEALQAKQMQDAKSYLYNVQPTKAEDARNLNFKTLPMFASNDALTVAASGWNFPILSRMAAVMRGNVVNTDRGYVSYARWNRGSNGALTVNRYSYSRGGYATTGSRGYTPRGGYVFNRNQQGWVPGRPLVNAGRFVSNVGNYARPTNGILGRIYQFRHGGRFFDGRGFRAWRTGGRGRGWNG